MEKLTQVPRSLLDDVLVYQAKSLSPRERDTALRELSVLAPSPDGNVGYEGAVYALGLKGQSKAAMALIRYMGATSAVLQLSPNEERDTTRLRAVFWPGDVHCPGTLSVGGGYVGGTLKVGGDLSSQNLIYGEGLQVGGQVQGPAPRQIATQPGRLERQDQAIDLRGEELDESGLQFG